jgi:hypothetical protein
MKSFAQVFAVVLVLGTSMLLPSCSSPAVQETRQSGIERRQSRVDSRTAARQERWNERGRREDARAQARFDSW